MSDGQRTSCACKVLRDSGSGGSPGTWRSGSTSCTSLSSTPRTGGPWSSPISVSIQPTPGLEGSPTSCSTTNSASAPWSTSFTKILGVDGAPAGLRNAERRASRLEASIRTELADLRTYRLREPFDVVFSSCALNHLPRKIRPQRFAHFQGATVLGGIHAVNAFVPRSRAPRTPDADPNETAFRPGELRGYYRGWEVLDSAAVDFDCHCRTGVPHQHHLEVLVARKPS
ncbi:MAG: class I SAM-dependent methyltransferase [Thermoplasmata archaeon]